MSRRRLLLSPAVLGDTISLDFPLSGCHAAGVPDQSLTTRAAFIEDLQHLAPTDWPAIWGSAYAHVMACLQAAYAELERLLAIPEMHRMRLKREMKEILRIIAEEGPEGPARFQEGGMVLRPDERRWRGNGSK